MAYFRYQAIDKSGKKVSGTLSAESRKAALLQLKGKQLQPLKVDSQEGAAPISTNSSEEATTKRSFDFKALMGKLKGSSNKEDTGGDKIALNLLRKLLQLHMSGLPIGDAIKTLSQRVSDPKLRHIASNLWKELSEGQTLADAMGHYPKTFDPSVTHLIEAGEATGNLRPVLINIVNLLETRAKMRKQLIASLVYPVFVCTVAIAVVALFLFFLLPRIETMLSSLGGELTFFARLLVGFSDFAVSKGPFVLVGIIAVALGYVQWRKTEKGKLITDKWLLKIPGLRSINWNIDVCRFTNLLQTLLESGVNMTEALKLTSKVIKNTHLVDRFEHARTMINDGASVSVALRKNELLSPIDLDILSVGENTGNITNSLEEIYKSHSEELSGQMKFLTNFISSGALALAFGLVAILTLGIVTSILQLSQNALGR